MIPDADRLHCANLILWKQTHNKMKYFGEDYFTFSKRFQTNDDCYEYLKKLKWDNGYMCRKCGCTSSIKGRTWYYLKCKECDHDESATSGTLFHKLKFPILKAFHIIFRLCVSKKGMSTLELSREFGLQQKTCWLFKRKVQEAMKSSDKNMLKGEVHVDEFSFGGPEKGKVGRSRSNKKVALLAMEIRENKNGKTTSGNAYAISIKDYSKESFKPLFEKKISKKAKIKTDGFATYDAFRKEYDLEENYSNKGLNFPEIHFHILNFKSWLRGIHHKCRKNYFQNYLDEFHYKFNRRNSRKTIFNNIVKKFIAEVPLPYKKIRELAA